MATEPVEVSRLEQILQVWEQYMWVASVLRQYSEALKDRTLLQLVPALTGPLVHYKNLRRHLLSIKSMDEFDVDRFVLTSDAQIVQLGFMAFLPSLLGAWVHSSRRVYSLDPDLQALLGATSLKDVTPKEVKLPFRSFAVKLAEPIIAANGKPMDFLLFAPLDGTANGQDYKSFVLVLLGPDLDHWRPLNSRATLEKQVSRGNVVRAGDYLAPRSEELLTGSGCSVSLMSLRTAEDIPTLLNTVNSGVGSGERQAWRIAFGLSLYLGMLPSDSPRVSRWTNVNPERRLASLDKRAITEESQICSVSSIRQLSTEDRALLNRYARERVGGHEMPAHFREGHWRRPWGTAHNPEQEKTVWIHPTFVRFDRLPEGGVAGGSEVILSRR